MAIEGETKNAPSVRLIPTPSCVLDILSEAQDRSEGDRDIAHYSGRYHFSDYGQEVGRYIRKWRPGCKFEPKGLRRTIIGEADRLDFLGQTLERYIRHTPKGISAVTFAHYLPNDLTGQVTLMREQIVCHVDQLLADHRARWNNRGGNMVPLIVGSLAG